MRPGLAKITGKVRISTYFESAETDLHIPENACCIDYADTWLVLAMVPDRHFESGSGSKLNHCQIGGRGCQ